MDRTEKFSYSPEMIDILSTYHHLFAPSLDSVFFLNSTGKIYDLNQSSADLLGYSRDELCGLKITDLVTKEDLNKDPLQLSSLQIDQVYVNEQKNTKKSWQGHPCRNPMAKTL